MPTILLTVSEAADRLTLSERHVRRLIAKGNIAATRLGPHTLRVAADEVERFIASRTDVARRPACACSGGLA